MFGLPNTGTDSLARYLDAYLKVNVTEGLARQGKHLMPFHPDFEDLLSAGCEADDDWTAVILTVRNPLAWFLDQTSDTEYQGHTCLPGDGEEICYFDSGFNGVSATARNTSEPARWEFPTLLDLWSAYADYLPLSLNTVMVVRYEDMMQDRESVRASVAQYFGADIKSAAFFQPDPMEDYLFDGTYNPDGLHSKLQHFETFECFWLQFGLHPSSKGARDQGIMPPKTVIDCVFQDEEHYIVYPEKMQPLSSAMERGIMQKAIQTHDYEIPSLAKIQQAWDACGLDIEAYHQDEFEDDEEDQEK